MNLPDETVRDIVSALMTIYTVRTGLPAITTRTENVDGKVLAYIEAGDFYEWMHDFVIQLA